MLKQREFRNPFARPFAGEEFPGRIVHKSNFNAKKMDFFLFVLIVFAGP